MPLRGTASSEVLERLRAGLGAAGLDPARLTVRTPADLPPGPLSDGKPFEADAAAAAELGRWFGLADDTARRGERAHSVTLPVPCWPDHFDLAVVVRVGAHGAAGRAGDLGSPRRRHDPRALPLRHAVADGDSGGREVPAPAGGRWQVEGWVGLALTASAVLAEIGTATGPQGVADSF